MQRPAPALRDYSELILYWLVAYAFALTAMLAHSPFQLSCMIVLWGSFLLWPLAIVRNAVLATTAIIFAAGAFFLKIPYFVSNFLPIDVFNETAYLITAFIVLIQSWKFFGVDPQSNPDLRRRLLTLLITVTGINLLSFPVGLLGHLRPDTYDFLLARMETHLSINPSVLLGVLFDKVFLLKVACAVFYLTLPTWLLLAAYAQSSRPAKPKVNMLVATCVTALGAVGYFIIPAVGPEQLYGTLWPYHVPADLNAWFAAHAAIDPHYVRNCMPSLHTAWAILLILTAREFPPAWRTLFMIAALANILATLGLGQHYTVDLAVAVPFSVAVWIGCHRGIGTRQTCAGIAACMTLVALWFWAMLAEMPLGWSPLLNWLAMAFTVLFSLALQATLERPAHWR